MKKLNKEQHDKEHKVWSRRQFLTTGGLAGLGSFMLGATPIAAFSDANLMAALNETDTDRVLVLIDLNGGNDSLNMVIPHSIDVGNDKYLEFRPNLGLRHNQDYQDNMLLSNYGPTNFALHPEMEPLMNVWHNDSMHIIHKVGYPNQNYSHFTSRDLWYGGADNKTDSRVSTGVMGRPLGELFPSFLDAPPSVPPALTIGGSTNTLFRNIDGVNMDLVFSNPSQFYTMANRGSFHDLDNLSDCPVGEELYHIRQATNNALRYAELTFEAYNNSSNAIPYENSSIGNQLAIIARLIKGKLGTKVYRLSLGGFDTHSDQMENHHKLLAALAKGISEFQEDLAASGDDERVITFCFSEFGRTIKENGGFSTDHGDMGDLMLFGKGLNGGFSGTPTNLHSAQLEVSTRATFEAEEGSIDYRSIYATLLQDWLCMDAAIVDYALGFSALGIPFPRIENLITNPCTTERDETPGIILGHRSKIDNPDITEIRYGILKPGKVIIDIYNNAGQQLVTLVNGHHVPGTYVFPLSRNDYQFPIGEYIYKMQTGGQEYLRKIDFF